MKCVLAVPMIKLQKSHEYLQDLLVLQRKCYSVLRHHGLAGGGVGGHQHGLVVLDAEHRAGLEGVQRELVGFGRLPHLRV